ncbi:UCH-domain-containing protein [Mytilinidion resinicola]|uniref:ubiquitinyl hydrolase 1 n=1 Tax=Mytilinidion resinicola TaxID=574789 RepID=A0A6A6Y4R5_9PEZI|nr:UCH-domain-containing protein [Mytilinidion resinicola]KAF2803650.1 UCH-domain-containing protein [Mytilinidion resinicola]
MDPQSASFTPRDDIWRMQNDMIRVQQNQVDLSERLSRVERRQDEDARVKSVWGTSSPFPSVLSGTPQQGPLHHPPPEAFSNFDDDRSNIIGSLQLDADDEPRRMGASSRAASVRFDETANQGHWAHASRSSLELIPRTGSGMGGHPMTERSYSHKSDGRQSSTGHSVYSATSGRANSLGLDTGYGLGNSGISPLDPPGLAPGLFVLGTVPAIIRCWLDTNFKHDTLLYAAVCSGSYTSSLDRRLINRLGFGERITEHEDGTRKIKLVVYLPEAVPSTASSRSSSPVPQVPSLNVTFTVFEGHEKGDGKPIQIFFGSDMLRYHNADLLLSSNRLTLFDDEGSKLQIPLVRPEDERTFKSLFVSSATPDYPKHAKEVEEVMVSTQMEPPALLEHQASINNQHAAPAPARSNGAASIVDSDDGASTGRRSLDQRPLIGIVTARTESKESDDFNSAAGSALRSSTSPAIWSNWRRDSEKTNSMDWANASKSAASTYQRKDTGIKVLKPIKPGARTASSSNIHSPSPVTGQSRFFDEGRRRTSTTSGSDVHDPQLKRSVSGEKAPSVSKDNQPALSKPRSANPVGGASAFAWLNRLSPSTACNQLRFFTTTSTSGTTSLPAPLCATPSTRPLAPSHSLAVPASRVPFHCTVLPPSELHKLPGWLPLFTTASIKAPAKKRKIAPTGPPDTEPRIDHNLPTSLNDVPGLTSPRSSPHPSSAALRTSASPPRYIPPHLHEEVLEASQDAGNQPRDTTATGASSPSDAYSRMTLEGGDSSSNMTQGRRDSTASTLSRSTEPSSQPSIRLPPRSSSPAKRPASDMEDGGKEAMDIDTLTTTGYGDQGAVQHSPRAAKPPPVPARSNLGDQKNTRAASVEMTDDTLNGVSAASSDTASVSNHESTATSTLPAPPSIDDQVAKVYELVQQPLVEGQEGYIVSSKWLERVMARAADATPGQFDKSATEGEIGPVDNSALVDESYFEDELTDERGEPFVRLKLGVDMAKDFEVVPSKAWDLIVSWYTIKDGTPTIRRYAHNTAPPEALENLQYELNPPIFTIRKLRKECSTQKPQEAPVISPRIVASRSESYQGFLRSAKSKASIDMNTKVRVWRLLAPAQQVAPAEPRSTPSGILTPESSRNGSPNPNPTRIPLLVDFAEFEAYDDAQCEKISGNDETANKNYNGHLNLQTIGLAEDQVLILEEQIGGPAGGEFPSDSTKKPTIKNGILGKSNAGRSRNKGADSGRGSPAPGGPITRGRTRRDGRTRGSVGLTNLGNTCYMNSALQCIRSVEELTLYFLEQKYKDDLNPGNPLGHGGAIAKNYAGLLAAVYDDTGLSTFTPKNFKYAVGRAQPLFSGYGQQDSQEFLSFLVDGLHEDLNRILKKPYVENPESDDATVNDPAAIRALGEKFREIHHARNDSVAMDLFNGFYKNTMVCPDCSKVSITFDPFSLLTLQLPIENTWQHTITLAPLHGQPVQIDVDLDKNGTIRTLKEFVARRIPGLKWNRLMCAEIYSHKFYRTFEDSKTIAESNIQSRDDIVMYELDAAPTNFPPPPKKKSKGYRSMVSWNNFSDDEIPDSDSPLADRMIVPVFHRVQNNNTYSNSMSLKLWPSYILITREEGRDYDSILRKIIAKVATMTTRPILTELGGSYGPFDESRNASDTVITTEDDASSNVDPRVQDGSIEGEGDMVGITVDEPVETPVDQAMEESATIEASRQLPDVLQPGSFIPPDFRNLFRMKYANASKELLPTGWHAVEPQKNYATIESRVRIPKSRRSSMDSTEDVQPSSSGEEADDTIQFSATAQDSFDHADQSSDEELPSVETFTRSDRRNNYKKSKRGTKKNKFTTYSKKGKGRFIDQPIYQNSEPEADEDPALIRLGEAIVLDWLPATFNALFEGTNEEELRGQDTWKVMGTLDDPELKQTKAQRAARRKNGVTLQECFAETSKGEILSEENAWYCSRCKELRRASKTLEIWTLPDILVVHLKRFSANRGFRDKIDVLVDFPIEGLDLSKRVGLPEDKETVYDLFAVDNHYGGLGGGHYTAFAQNFYDKEWYEYNDSSVSRRKDPASVVTPAAYLLFYRRRSASPLGPPYLQKVVEAAYAPNSEEAPEDGSQANSRQGSRSPAGNGLRLDGLSRNGSSSAGIGAGAGLLLRGGGLASAAGKEAGNHRGTEIQEEDENTDVDLDEPLPGYNDSGYEDEDNTLVGLGGYSTELWNFAGVPIQDHGMGDDDDMASNAAMGSNESDDLGGRMLQDFGDDMNQHPGTPQSENDEVPDLLPEDREMIRGLPIPIPTLNVQGTDYEDDKVADVVLDDVSPNSTSHAKSD